uniref:DUF1836 domain-containing protein n=1 Tax=Parolsenella massiliensis TaxID=1871022 RepID=UPI000933B06B|nr:DUF1836 domain-containing protein [Parolsenella massiliensis]
MTLDEDNERALARRMREAHIMRIDELPRIELYLDQVLTLVSQSLSFMASPGEDIITGSMVNNYVKQHVVPAPQRRRYTRRHVATLTYVCAFKCVFSINEIKALYEACVDAGVNVSLAYDELAASLERALASRFGGAEPVAAPSVRLLGASGVEVAPELSRIMGAAVEAVADKVFVEQSLSLMR